MTQLQGRMLIGGNLTPGSLRIEAGRIADLAFGCAPDTELAQLPIITPGFIDLHIHGFGGCDPLDNLAGMAQALARAGTTAFQPTLFPRAPRALGEDARQVWASAATLKGQAVARAVGLHAEGPFLNPKAAGAIPVEDIVTPSVADLRAILGPATGDGNGLKTMTIAPEVAGSSDVIAELVRAGVRVSLGHSQAHARDGKEAVRAGATGATHLFNAMSGVRHREMGLAGCVLSARDLFAEIIGDLNHVEAEGFELALAARGPDGLCLVSDALSGAGTGCDVFHSHGRDHIVRDGTAYYPPRDEGGEPQLAGCASSQLEMVRKLVARGVCSVEEALTMASETPAKALGLDHELGRIFNGAKADLLVLSGAALQLTRVFVDGREVALGAPS